MRLFGRVFFMIMGAWLLWLAVEAFSALPTPLIHLYGDRPRSPMWGSPAHAHWIAAGLTVGALVCFYFALSGKRD